MVCQEFVSAPWRYLNQLTSRQIEKFQPSKAQWDEFAQKSIAGFNFNDLFSFTDLGNKKTRIQFENNMFQSG